MSLSPATTPGSPTKEGTDSMNCILCGISRQHTTELSHHTAKSITDLIQQRCSRGPLVYPTIMEWDQPTVCACRLCFHQLKRRSKGGKLAQCSSFVMVLNLIPYLT